MDEFGRSRRGRGGEDSPSPPPPPPNRRRPRSPSPQPRGERREALRPAVQSTDRRHSAGDRRRSQSPHNKRRRYSTSPRRGDGPRGRSPGGRPPQLPPQREPVGWGIASMLRDVGHLVSLTEFEDKLANAISTKYASRDLSPTSKRNAVEKDYVQYVEAFKSDTRGGGGEAMRFLMHHSDEEWFWERYHSDGQARVAKVKAEEVQANLLQCLKEVDLETLAPVGFTMQAEEKRVVSKASPRKDCQDGKQQHSKSGKSEDDNKEADGEAAGPGAEAGGDDDEEGAAGSRSGGPEEKEDGGEGKSVSEQGHAAGGKPDGDGKDGDADQEADASMDGLEGGKEDAKGVVEVGGVAGWCREEATAARSVFIRNLPAKATRGQVLGVLSKARGFVRLVLSEALRTKGWSRIGWATFESEADALAAVKELDGMTVMPLHAGREHATASPAADKDQDGGGAEVQASKGAMDTQDKRVEGGKQVGNAAAGGDADENGKGDEGKDNKASKVHGVQFRLSCTTSRGVQTHKLVVKTCHPAASTPRRMALDLPLLIDLCKALDAERRIEGNAILQRVESAGEDIELGVRVDALVHYLRRVHLLCYYRGEEYNDVGDMIRKGAATLVRPKLDAAHKDEGKESEWERSLVSRLRRRIALAIENKEMRDTAGESQEAPAGPALAVHKKLLASFFASNCFEKEKNEKYMCMVPFKGTNKVFKAPEFVHKHLWNKHWGLVKEELCQMSFLMDAQRPSEPAMGGQGGGHTGWMAQGGGRGHTHGYEGRGMGGHMGPGMAPFGGGMRGMHPMAAMAKMQETMAMMMGGMPMMRGGRMGGDMRGDSRSDFGASRGHPRGGGLDACMGGAAPDQKKDPRAVKAYVDLDAAGTSADVFAIDYRSPAY